MYFHHIYFTFDNTKTPLQNEAKIIDKYIRKHCSNLEYEFWNFQRALDFVKEHYPCFIDFFTLDTEFPIVKCDVFRYMLMYHFGGVYADLDFICIRPFDHFIQLLNESKIHYYPNHVKSPTVILSEEWLNSASFTNTLHNGILISLQPKHPFWLGLMFDVYHTVMINKRLITCKTDVFEISGPKKLNHYYNSVKNNFSDICVLPYYYFCPYISIDTNGNRVLYNNAMIELPKTDDVNWVFFNIQDHQQLTDVCPNSFFVCIYLNTGSMWK